MQWAQRIVASMGDRPPKDTTGVYAREQIFLQELGPAGLHARYALLAYPGTGGHMSHVAVAGADHLREYVFAGGGFFGICAGQFLATELALEPCDSLCIQATRWASRGLP